MILHYISFSSLKKLNSIQQLRLYNTQICSYRARLYIVIYCKLLSKATVSTIGVWHQTNLHQKCLQSAPILIYNI